MFFACVCMCLFVYEADAKNVAPLRVEDEMHVCSCYFIRSASHANHFLKHK